MWLSRRKPILILLYDDLKMELPSQLIRICQFLNVTCSDELLDCVVAKSEGNFHRAPHNETHLFSQEAIKLAKDYEKKIMTQVKKKLPGQTIEEQYF